MDRIIDIAPSILHHNHHQNPDDVPVFSDVTEMKWRFKNRSSGFPADEMKWRFKNRSSGFPAD
jgi:hypothetical protein